MLVYASRQHSERFDLYRKSVDGRTVTQLTSDPADDMMPAISPDGTRIAFVSNRAGNWDVYAMPIEGGAPTQITFDGDDEVQPTWSPDGSTIAFARRNRRTDRWEIWTADTRLPGATTYLCDGFLPRWCPDPKANKLLFQRARQQGSRLFGVWTVDIVDGEATNPTEIVSAQDAAVVQPAWSPDGSHIVFATIMDPTSTAASHTDLWTIKADGSGRINLTSDRFRNMQPVWGRNDRIYFVSNRGGVENIWSLAPSVPVQSIMPGPSPDGSQPLGSGGIAGVAEKHESQP
jgi:TolB protein